MAVSKMEQEHIKLVNDMNRELGELKGDIKNLAEKIEENHEVHIENREDIKKILVQTTITNGRVTDLEKINKSRAVESENWTKVKWSLTDKIIFAAIVVLFSNLKHILEIIERLFN